MKQFLLFSFFSMTNDQQEAQDVITQPQGLQMQQAALISCLEQATESEETNNPPSPPAHAASNQTREFVVGDRVHIRNPRHPQEERGTIIRIGARIAAKTPSRGNTMARVAKNLIFDNE
jgi:hypothetical protein